MPWHNDRLFSLIVYNYWIITIIENNTWSVRRKHQTYENLLCSHPATMCIGVHACIHVCTCMLACAYVYMHVCVCMHACPLCVCVTCVRACVYACVRAFVRAHTCDHYHRPPGSLQREVLGKYAIQCRLRLLAMDHLLL